MPAFVDALGQRHWPPVPGEPLRIACLVPSLTELLVDLGLAPKLVARTGFCIHPAEQVAAIPKVGGTKDVNLDKLRALSPTHVVVNVDENEKPTVDEIASFVPHVIVTDPQQPQDNPALYRLLGGILGRGGEAEQMARVFEQEYQRVKSQPWPEKRVLYCIWQDPWMTVAPGTYIANMLALAGLTQVSVSQPDGERYPRFQWSSELTRGLDHVLLSSEPYRFTEEHADKLEQQLGLPVSLVDGEMISWYGSRAIAGLRYLEQMARELSGS